MKQTAIEYIKAKLSVIPCRNKRPIVSWDKYKSVIATPEEIAELFDSKNCDQIAIIAGKVSSNLQVIDVDSKYAIDPDKFLKEFSEGLSDIFGEQMSMLPIASTPSGGMHVFFKCSDIEGNKKLASRPATKDELKTKSHEKQKCIIETRAEGGYVIVAPSEGYKMTNGDLLAIPKFSIDERDQLLNFCRSFNEIVNETIKAPKTLSHSIYKNTPWDAYDASNEWEGLLSKHGWEAVAKQSGRIHYRRPGSENKWSANWHIEKRLFYVFTSSTQFENEKAYSPFAMYAILECDGDFKRATLEVKKQGFGEVFADDEILLIDKIADKKEQGFDWSDVIKAFPEILGKTDDVKKKLDQASTSKLLAKKGIFWNKGKRGAITLSNSKLAEFLYSIIGLRLIVDSNHAKKYRTAIIQGSIIREVVLFNIKNAVKAWLIEFQKKEDFSDYEIDLGMILDLLIKLSDKQWLSIIEFIPYTPISKFTFLDDTRDTSYYPFINGIFKIVPESVGPSTLLIYDDLPPNTLIWAESIIDHVLVMGQTPDPNKKYFRRFLGRLAGNKDTMTAKERKLFTERFDAILTQVGYLSRKFKNKSQSYLVVIAEDLPDSAEGGGTGKGLLMQCISKIRKVHRIDGRNWNPEGQFAYQGVNLDTDIVFIDDAFEYFKIANLYNQVTDGMHVENKFQGMFYMDFDQSPKIVMTTNFAAMREKSIHARRRVRKMLVQKHFTIDHQPVDEFDGKEFFRDWDHEDWNTFYFDMFLCIQHQMNRDQVLDMDSDNMEKKTLKSLLGDHSESMDTFLRQLFEEQVASKFSIPKDKLWGDFKSAHLDNSSKWKRKFFIDGVKDFCKAYGIKCVDERLNSGEHRNRYCFTFSEFSNNLEDAGITKEDPPF